ncbi:hypothetical protein, partial [Geodermatophilus maliterrae]
MSARRMKGLFIEIQRRRRQVLFGPGEPEGQRAPRVGSQPVVSIELVVSSAASWTDKDLSGEGFWPPSGVG